MIDSVPKSPNALANEGGAAGAAATTAPAAVPAPENPAAAQPKEAPLAAALEVAPGPHVHSTALTTRRMMIDVLCGLALPLGVAIYVFHWHAVLQVGLAVLSCLAFEALLSRMAGKRADLLDGSAAVTGAILGLSLPWSAPWYVSVVAGGIAMGIGKVVFGGLGQNIFNPAMVGRAFVMIAFPAALGASGYVVASGFADVVTQATPLTAAKQLGILPELWPLLVGIRNGSLGEVSALACLVGGVYLCVRRTASWEIPAGMLLTVAALAGLAQLAAGPESTIPILRMTMLDHLLSGALLFGAFFIATDPVTSPLTPRGKLLFGAGTGVLVMIIRWFSGYPEGVMFAVLMMNGLTPMLNRWSIPTPVGGPVPAKR